MTVQLLIYKSPALVSRERHADCSIEPARDFGFCAGVNSAPLLAPEFANAAAEFPVVFVGPRDQMMPTVLLGVRDGENVFVGRNGRWAARYVPAFFRRYPFVFSREGEQLLLSVDEAYSGLNREGRGQRMFNDDRTPSAYLDGVVRFLNEYHAQHERTRAFCTRIWELGLLEDVKAQVTVTPEMQFSLGGFMAVERSRIRALGGDTLAQLVQADELELLYLHLYSMKNFDALRERTLAARVTVSYPATGDDAGTILSDPSKRKTVH